MFTIFSTYQESNATQQWQTELARTVPVMIYVIAVSCFVAYQFIMLAKIIKNHTQLSKDNWKKISFRRMEQN